MCIEGENAFWLDVLENGPSSPYASFFDIDWHPVKQELENKILIPILGDQFARDKRAEKPCT
jgi:(1->4)-alpha-D-glucan 1-alpha-D-glucosylmutase